MLATGEHPGSFSAVFAAGPETSPEYTNQYSRRLRNSILATGDPGLIFEVFAALPLAIYPLRAWVSQDAHVKFLFVGC